MLAAMRYRLVTILWLASDLLLFVASYVLAYFVRLGWIFSSSFPIQPYLWMAIAVSPLWLFVLATTGTFRPTQSQSDRRQFFALFYANIVGSALFALGYFYVYNIFFSRLLLVEALLLSTAILRIWHLAYEGILRRSLRRDPATFPTLIVGVTRESERLVERLMTRRNPLKPVAVLDGRGTSKKHLAGVPVLGKLDKLETTLREHGITHLIQCSDLEQSLNLLSACRALNITYVLLPSVLGIVEHDERVESLEGMAVMVVRPSAR